MRQTASTLRRQRLSVSGRATRRSTAGVCAWLPQSVLDADAAAGNHRRERDSVPYSLWVKRGLMRAVPGNKVDKQVMLDWFMELRDEDDLYVRYIGYDPWHNLTIACSTASRPSLASSA